MESTLASFSMIAGGLAIFWRNTCRLMKYGSQVVSSYEMKLFVGTEKTSADS